MRKIIITAVASLMLSTSVQAQSLEQLEAEQLQAINEAQALHLELQEKYQKRLDLHRPLPDLWLVSAAKFWDQSGRPAELVADSDAERAVCSDWDSRARDRQQRVRTVRHREMVQSLIGVFAYGPYGVSTFEESLGLQRDFNLVDEFCAA